jgi:glycosyltransferase involved in cell wall biosynthesis
MKSKLSVTIITLNEEENIKNAILSVKFADEIIVVDSGSDDSTVEIAKKLGAKVFTNKFDNFADQKNFAAQKASGEWILSLDADEEVSGELAKEIEGLLATSEYDGFLMPRKNIILGGEIKHSRWSPDIHIWLWKSGKGRWVGKVHEEMVIDGKVGRLTHAKIHNQDKTIFEFMLSLNEYTQVEAEEAFAKGIKFSFLKMIFSGIKSFVGRYIYKQGYLDGWRGLVLCSLRAFYHSLVWLKILELQNNARK